MSTEKAKEIIGKNLFRQNVILYCLEAKTLSEMMVVFAFFH
jgi:hypothetical protein